jgi:hypothetical protein
MAIDDDSKQEILHEISEIRALLTRLQPVSAAPVTSQQQHQREAGGKRTLIIF